MSLARSSRSWRCELKPCTPWPLSFQAEKSGFAVCVSRKCGGLASCSPACTAGTVSEAGSYIASQGSGTRYLGCGSKKLDQRKKRSPRSAYPASRSQQRSAIQVP